MSLATNDRSLDIPSQSNAPVCLSIYLVDACKQGRLFSIDTYNIDSLNSWLSGWSRRTVSNIPFPSRFQETGVERIFRDKVVGKLEKSDLLNMFESVDVDDIDSIENLLAESRNIVRSNLETLENFLKQSEFPPFLWMEYSRFSRVFIETSEFMQKRVVKWFELRPKRISQIHERSRQTRAMFSTYEKLVDDYFKTLSNYMRMGIFMEVWSCNEESELFTEKCIWTFRNIKPRLFEPMFFEFHDSIGQLRQSFFAFSPQETKIDFSKPTDWAFKQLVQMA